MRFVLAPVLSSIALGGCLYMPSSYSFESHPFVGKRVALTCLDVAVAMTDDNRATSPVVRYSFGNRCTHETTVDLGAVPAYGLATNGEHVAMHAYDPRHELRPLPIDGWWRGSESIMYTTVNGEPPPLAVCVDVGAIEGPATQTHREVCVGAVEL
jgi:hypothetical protein